MEQKKGLKKLGNNIIIFLLGSFASKMMNYFMLPFYTSILTQTEYGIYDIVATTSNLLYPFTTLLITEATMRFALDKVYDRKKVLSLSILTSGLGFIGFLIISPLILFSALYKVYYFHFVLFHFFVTIHTLLSQYAKGIEKTRKYATSGIVGTFCTLSSNIILMAIFNYGLKGYFISYYLGSFASSIYLFFSCKIWQEFTYLNKKDFQLLKEMLRYSLPIMPNAVSWWISTSSDKYLINYYAGVDVTGLYSIAYKIPSLMTVFTSIFFNAWQITAVEDFGSNEANKRFTHVYNWLFAIVLTMSSMIILFSKLIARILFSDSFYDAWCFIPFLIVAYVFHDLSTYIGSIYTSMKKTEMLFVSTLIGAILNVILNLFFIAKWGAIGAAITTLISYYTVWVIRLLDTKKYSVINYSYTKDGLSVILLILEMIIISINSNYSWFIGVLLVLVILIINAKSLLNVLKVVFIKRGVE